MKQLSKDPTSGILRLRSFDTSPSSDPAPEPSRLPSGVGGKKNAHVGLCRPKRADESASPDSQFSLQPEAVPLGQDRFRSWAGAVLATAGGLPLAACQTGGLPLAACLWRLAYGPLAAFGGASKVPGQPTDRSEGCRPGVHHGPVPLRLLKQFVASLTRSCQWGARRKKEGPTVGGPIFSVLCWDTPAAAGIPCFYQTDAWPRERSNRGETVMA